MAPDPTPTRPSILAVLNATSDSFSGNMAAADGAVELAGRLLDEGADVIDIGAQSLRTDRPEVPVDVEVRELLARLEPVRAAFPDATISVDTYRSEVAAAAVAAGADLVNDPSGLSDPAMADVVAAAGVGYVLTYNRARPKVRLAREELAADVVEDCLATVADRRERLDAAGVPASRLVLDPGPDLGKSPGQTIEILRHMDRVRAATDIERVLWALSRKDFIGALLGRRPSGRDAGTLGAIAAVDPRPGDLLRVHDVRAASDFLRVRHAIAAGSYDGLELHPDLRHDV